MRLQRRRRLLLLHVRLLLLHVRLGSCCGCCCMCGWAAAAAGQLLQLLHVRLRLLRQLLLLLHVRLRLLPRLLLRLLLLLLLLHVRRLRQLPHRAPSGVPTATMRWQATLKGYPGTGL